MTTARTLPDLELAARRFRALSDETRLRIVAMLRNGEQCVCDLTAALEVGQSLLSFHLRTLREAGLVRDRREGRWSYYALDGEALEEMREALAALHPGGDGEGPAARCCG